MNIDWDKDESIGLKRGGFKDVKKERKEQLPKIQERINKFFKDYKGENLALVTIKEDEKGNPESTDMQIIGIGSALSLAFLSKSLDDASKTALDALVNSAKGSFAASIEVAQAIQTVEKTIKEEQE